MTAQIGGNNPPPLEAHSLHIEELFSTVSATLAGGDITTDEQEAAIDGLLDEVRTARKGAEDQCETEYRPHKLAADKTKKDWKPLLDRCDKAVEAIRVALTPYRNAKQAAKDAEAKRLREAAEKAAEEARQALRSSDELEDRFAAEEQLKSAAKLQAVANRIDRTATGLRTHWEAEITDRRAALNHYLKHSPEAFVILIQDLADKDARNQATRVNVPGVAFHERKKAA